MEEDIIASLTRQVKEEVIENYLNERQLLELQREEFDEEVRQTKHLAQAVGRRLTRMAFLTIHPDMLQKLSAILQTPQPSFWSGFLHVQPSKGVRFIRVRGLTERGKYRKLLLEAYQRLYDQMEAYRKKYEDLEASCRALNINIRNFEKNFDLLSILQFLRSLDVQALERKHFLGENFTAEEIASLDMKLQIKTIDFNKLEVPPPFSLPRPALVEHRLVDLSAEVFRKYEKEVRDLILK